MVGGNDGLEEFLFNSEVNKIPHHRFNGNDSVTEKANQLYKEIRDKLSADDFSLFAKHISLLNSGKITVDETMNAISKIIKDQSLVVRFQHLLLQAEDQIQ